MESVTIEHIIPFVTDHRHMGYFLLFMAMVLEGEVFLIIAGMLAHLKAFDIGDVLWIAFAGIITGNILWYFLGIMLSTKKFMQPAITRAQKVVLYFLPHFSEKPFKSIFFSKFIYGANRATVLIAGVLKVRFPVFAKVEFFASIIWIFVYTALGYFAGYAAIHFTHKATHFALLIAIFVVGFIVLRGLVPKLYERYKHFTTKTDHHAQR